MSNRRKIRASCPCVDCGWLTVRRGQPSEWYMVHDCVWQAAGMPAEADLTRYLCIGCLENRLGRQLTAADFTGADVNSLDGSHRSERLTARLIDGVRA